MADFPQSYDFNRTLNAARRAFGPPTEIRNGGHSYVWKHGNAVLTLYQFITRPLRCQLHIGQFDDVGMCVVSLYAHESFSVKCALRQFAEWSERALTEDVAIHLVDFVPHVNSEPLPVALVPLAWQVLRGELEPALFLDALKHDTELLG